MQGLAAETIEKLQALPDPKVPSGTVRSKFMKKFRPLEKMDPRRLEINDKKNATHVCSFCNQCFSLEWRSRREKDGSISDRRGSYDTTKALRHLNQDCTGGGRQCPEIIEYRFELEHRGKRKMETGPDEEKQEHVKKKKARMKSNTEKLLEALPDPKVPTGTVRSKFMKKFHLLYKMDPRRLEINDKKNATHVCSFCNQCFSLEWRRRRDKDGSFMDDPGKGSYDTTKALRHLHQDCTGGGQQCPEIIEYRNQLENREKKKKAETGSAGGQKGQGKKKKAKKQLSITSMLDPRTYRDKALCSQAHFFVYSEPPVPFSTFEDPVFQEMLTAMIPPNQEVENPPILNQSGVEEYINSEFELFKTCLHKELEPMVKDSKGNAFCRMIHDDVTSENRFEPKAFGIQFCNNKFRRNHVVALGFLDVQNDTTNAESDPRKDIFKERTSYDLNQIVSSTVQDAAATKRIADTWDLEVETFVDMHDGDEVGVSAIGRPVRDKLRNVLDPFPAGQALEKKLDDQAKHFSCSHSNRQRYMDIVGSAAEDQDLTTIIKQDLCEAGINNFHELLRSSLKLKKSLDLYFSTRSNEPGSSITDFLTTDDWRFALEVEAILNISKDVIAMSQAENEFNVAYTPIVRNSMHKKLTEDKIMVIDVTNWGNTKRAARKEVDVNTFTKNGRDCRKRSILECERCFFGYNGEERMNAEDVQVKMKLSKREKATLFLDKRTCLQKSILKEKEEWTDAKKQLESFYIDFYKNRKLHDWDNSRRDSMRNNLRKLVQKVPSSSRTFDLFDDDSDSNSANDEEHAFGQPSRIHNEMEDILKAKQEFEKVIKKWCRWKPDWKGLFPEKELTSTLDIDSGTEICEPDALKELIDINMARLMHYIEQYNSDNGNVFGYLPMMCRLSPCQLGGLNSKGFVERTNTCAKFIAGDEKANLNHELVEKLAVLRMNRNFMMYCRQRDLIGKVKTVQNNAMLERIYQA